MGGVVTKEQAISHAQYLDLVYSKSGTLYDLIPHTSRPTLDPSRHATKAPVDGILGSVQTQLKTKYVKKKNQPFNQPIPPPKTTSPLVVSIEVNAIQSAESSRGKKKTKNKTNKSDKQQEGKTQNHDVDSKNKGKEKFPYLIHGGDHFTKECLRGGSQQFFEKSIHPDSSYRPFPHPTTID